MKITKPGNSKVLTVLVATVFLISMIATINAASLRTWDKTAVSEYNSAKAEYLKLRNFYKDARADWITAKQKYQNSKNAQNTGEALEKGKDFLLKADKTLVAYLETISTYVDGEPSLSDTEKANIQSELISDINWLENKQSEIEDASTKSELTDLAKQVRERWNEIKPATKRIVGDIMNSKVLWLINRAEEASVKVEDKITELQDNGKDTTDLENWLDDFNEKIELAKEKHTQAKNQFASIKNVQDSDKLFREGNAFTKEANQYIRNAYKDLKNIAIELRNQ